SYTTKNMLLYQVDAEVPKNFPAILLAHEPDVAIYTSKIGKFGLQISGHSHGGQINLPLLGPITLPEMGMLYPAGLYTLGDLLLYTNRGIGMTHIPIRMNCPPEITVFTFTSSL
ncbi:MAG: metallophosphoesterase, partial [Anaerolineaceae bacterium]|nr:metallophosphoesterase [Anaerolineaceae bacterium]